MDKPHPPSSKLTKNDQEVLKVILQQAKLPDTAIARKIGISPQGVFKIRRKLEESGIIKGYQPVLDLKKVGIQVMALLIVKLTPEVWETSTEERVSERIREIPYVINACRVVEGNASHILLLGFRHREQLDKYLAKLQTKWSREINIQQVYVFSTDMIITPSRSGVLYEILDKKEFPSEEFLLKGK